MSQEELAKFMLEVQSAFLNRLDTLDITKMHTARRINEHKILSVYSLSVVFGVSEYRIRKWVKAEDIPLTRGRLNPRHIPQLQYMLTQHRADTQEVKDMMDSGTTITMIATLTQVSLSTLQRRVRD